MGNKRKLRLSDRRKNKRLLTKRRLLERKEVKDTSTPRSTSKVSQPYVTTPKHEVEVSECTGTDDSNATVLHPILSESENIERSDGSENQFAMVSETLQPVPSTQQNVQRSDRSEKLLQDGNRIINAKYFIEQILSFKHCGLFSCTSQDIKIMEEKKKGFVSEFILECGICKVKHSVSTNKNDGKLNANTAAVLGTISIGCGYSQLTEFVSTLNIPPMSYRLYKYEETNLQKTLEKENWKTMIEAGKMEAKLAKENGEVDENGIPLITVIADGAWCKRSYRSAYNAHSGAACIVGQKTGKLLYVGIRNKFCATCQHNSGDGDHGAHLCFKNWTGTSTSMESNIILEGFKRSLEIHGVKYAFLVGDGDSSVFRKLQSEKPYGNFEIQKIECSNHLLRNYSNNLKQLATKKFSSKGQIIDTSLRLSFKNNIQRLRVAVECAVKYRRQQDVSFQDKVMNLRKDIENSVSHVFGDHSRCDDYFCKGTKSTEINLISNMKECGLYNDIMSHTNRLIYNSRSLVKNMTNNHAESYNSVIAKFIGGKRIDFSKKGSYQMRCHAAGLSFNEGSEYHSTLHRALTGKSPGQHTKKFIRSRKHNASYLSGRRKLFGKKRSENRHKSGMISQGPDEDYGDIQEISDEEWSKRKQIFLGNLNKNKKEIIQLMEKTKDQRESVLWLQERRKRLTASVFGKICKLRSTTDPLKTARQLLRTFSSASTAYGIENEPTALREFSEKIQQVIVPSGLFVDENDAYLGATPDGLIGQQGLVEIKCPYSCRNLTPLEAMTSKKLIYMELQSGEFCLKKSHNYYFQVQGQLHVTGKEFCYFVVWMPKGIVYEKIFRDDEFFNKHMKEKLKTFYFSYYLPEIIQLEYK